MNSNILTCILLVFSIQSLGQDWEIMHVDPDGDGSVEVKVEVYQDEIHVAAKGGWSELFYYYSADKGKTWKKTHMGKITHRTFEVGEVASVIDKKGVYHLSYFSKKNDIIHAQKTGPDSWVYDTIWKSNGRYSDSWHRIFMGCNESNQLRAFFKDHDTLVYFRQLGNQWKRNKVRLVERRGFHEETFGLDHNGNPHLVISDYDEKLWHFYSEDDGQTWKDELIGEFNSEGKLAMKLDSKGSPHVAFVQEERKFRGSTEVELTTYAYKDKGVWKKKVLELGIRDESKKNEMSTYYIHFPSIELDKEDGVHIGYLPGRDEYNGYPYGDTIVYAYKAPGKTEFVQSAVPCADTWYPGLHLRATDDALYYAMIGSTDGRTDDKGIELLRRPLNFEEEDEVDTASTKKIEIQGSLTIKSGNILFELWDNGEEDGDIVNVKLNNEFIAQDFNLTNRHQYIQSELKAGQTYSLSFESVSEGKYPPCTAVLIVNDGIEQHRLLISSDKTTTGTIQIQVQE